MAESLASMNVWSVARIEDLHLLVSGRSHGCDLKLNENNESIIDLNEFSDKVLSFSNGRSNLCFSSLIEISSSLAIDNSKREVEVLK